MIGKIKKYGKLGEDIAVRFLLEEGHRITARNLRVGNKEIDILSEDGEYLVFTEVKTRTPEADADLPRPAHAVDRNKKNNLIEAVRRYTRTYSPALIPRIDVIEVFLSEGSQPRVEQIRSAVTQDDYRPKRRKR
ncbi:MAG: YraN family protein [Eubacteriales bacterium]|nr:YraN family protein [Eubacteriales bacterium]